MTPDQPPEPKPQFDEAVCDRLRDCFRDVFLHFPEVKALAAAITWNGPLNDAKILHGVWLGPDGVVQTPDGVATGIVQTLKLLDSQFGQAEALAINYRDRLHVLGTELVDVTQKLAAARAELEAARRGRGGTGPGDPDPAPGPAGDS